MPDNERPAAKSEPEAAPGEFDFANSTDENPRIKKRSLRPQTENKLRPVQETPPAARDLEREAPPRTTSAAPSAGVSATDRDDGIKETVRKQAAATSAQPHFNKPARPAGTTETTSPHGTRPATLYYSTGANKDKNKEPASPMKTTTPTPSSTTSPSSAPTRPVSVVDYRSNMERQAREQKSIGNLLAIIVYVLIGFFVLVSSLAGYGLYALSMQIKKQSLTIDELDKHYAAENQQLAAQIQSTLNTLTQAQAQIGRQQSLILQEQEQINRLSAANDANAAALRQERAARADAVADLRDRIRDLDYHGGPTTQRY